MPFREINYGIQGHSMQVANLRYLNYQYTFLYHQSIMGQVMDTTTRLLNITPLDLQSLAEDSSKLQFISSRFVKDSKGKLLHFDEDAIDRQLRELCKNLDVLDIDKNVRLFQTSKDEGVQEKTARLRSEWDTIVKPKLKEFTRSVLLLEAEKVKTRNAIDDSIDKYYPHRKSNHHDYKYGSGALDEELEAANKDQPSKTSDKKGRDKSYKRSAQPKKYKRKMDLLAAGSMSAIAALIIAAFVWPAALGPEPSGPSNIPLTVLQSQFMLAIIGTVIAPIFVRTMKEKYDVQIEQSQVTMIMTDAINAVKLYQNEANKLRGPDGRIPPDYQAKLRDLAWDSIKTNYSGEKYKELAESVGVQVFDKAIEEAVKRHWINRFPIEQQQVRALISQSIDAFPYIVEWKDLDESVKIAFLEGHVKRLLATVKLERWGYTQLSEMFDAEITKRLLGATLAEERGILTNLDTSNHYIKYSSTIADSAIRSLVK